MLNVETIGRLLFVGLILGIVGYVVSKVSAFTTGAYGGPSIIYILQDYKSTYGFLPATAEPTLLKDALYPFASPYVDWSKSKTNLPVLKDAEFKINDPAMWYYHCPPSPPGQLSTLTLTAPIIHDRDIKIAINWHRAATGWQYKVVAEGGKKYLVMTTKALCREISRK